MIIFYLSNALLRLAVNLFSLFKIYRALLMQAVQVCSFSSYVHRYVSGYTERYLSRL